MLLIIHVLMSLRKFSAVHKEFSIHSVVLICEEASEYTRGAEVAQW